MQVIALPRKVIMYLRIKSEICPEYIRNIALKTRNMNLLIRYTFTSENLIIPRAESIGSHEPRGFILHIKCMTFFCNTDILLIFEATEQPHIWLQYAT